MALSTLQSALNNLISTNAILLCRDFPRFSLSQICKRPEIYIAPPTGRKWLSQRNERGDLACRRTRQQGKPLGRPPAIREETLDELLDEDDPAHNAHYDTQVKIKNLPVKGATLQANLSKRRGARRFKKSTIKGISRQNKNERVSYGKEFENRTINSSTSGGISSLPTRSTVVFQLRTRLNSSSSRRCSPHHPAANALNPVHQSRSRHEDR
jgi:hypothetical protein